MSAPGKNQGPVSILSRSLLFPISHDDELCWASPLFVPLISAHLSCLPSIHPSRAGPRVTLRRKRVSPNSRLLILDAFVLLFPFNPEFLPTVQQRLSLGRRKAGGILDECPLSSFLFYLPPSRRPRRSVSGLRYGQYMTSGLSSSPPVVL